MRLTLRTLLAYLDDILDPADKEELSKKVESSEFAAELIHRTRDTTRRLRLSAPQIVGTGMGLDPNTVAEYLDNVLPPDSVGDFERICLESDMHLAEVASCHHVLTMVLGEPADVDPSSRLRMYAIPGEPAGAKQVRVEPAHVAAVAAVPEPVAMAAAAPAIRSDALVNQSILMEVPDYLRASAWSRYGRAMVGLAALLLVGAVILFVPAVRNSLFGDGKTTQTMANNSNSPNGGGRAIDDDAQAMPAPMGLVESPSAKAQSPPANLPPLANINDPSTSVAGAGADITPPLPAPAANPPIPPQSTPATSAMASGTEPTTIPPATSAVGSADTSIAASGGETPRTGTDTMPSSTGTALPVWPPAVGDGGMAAGGTASGATVAGGTTGNSNMGSTAAGSNAMGTQAPPAADIATMPAMPVTGGAGTVGAGADLSGMPPASATPLVPANANIGTFLGGKTVLLRYNDKSQSWFRVEPRAAVAIGDRLLALPEFRPRITLANGVSVDLSGGTLAMVKTADFAPAQGLPLGDPRTPAIEILYGRIVLLNTAVDEQRLRLTTGTSTAEVRLARNATLGVQVTRAFVPGTDPRQHPSPVLTEYIAPAGGVVWLDESGERPITDSARWTVADGVVSAPSALTKPVEWIDREPTGRSSVQLAVPAIELALSTDRPADEQLLDAYDDAKRPEVKALAARCSMHVGMFVPFVRALRDSDQRTNWRMHIDALRVAMSLSPESSEKVWQTLVNERGMRVATDLYEMLCGYSLDQVGRTPELRKNPAGPLARLINSLASDNLDYRVLAVENLWEITGKRLMPNPAGSPTERANGIKEWTKRLTSDEMLPPATAAK